MRTKVESSDERNDSGNIFDNFSFNAKRSSDNSDSLQGKSRDDIEGISSSSDDGWLSKRSKDQNGKWQRLQKGKKPSSENQKNGPSGSSSSDDNVSIQQFYQTTCNEKKKQRPKRSRFAVTDLRSNPPRAARNKPKKDCVWLDDDSDYSDGVKKKKPGRRRKQSVNSDESEGGYFSESMLAGDSEEEGSSSASDGDLAIYHEEDLRYIANLNLGKKPGGNSQTSEDSMEDSDKRSDSDGEESSRKEWACPKCTLKNAFVETVCAACSHPTTLVMKKQSWDCLICTLTNAWEASMCAACESPRPTNEAENSFVIEDSDEDIKPQKKRSRIQKGPRKQESKIETALKNARKRKKAAASKKAAANLPKLQQTSSRAARAQNRSLKRTVTQGDEEPEFDEAAYPESDQSAESDYDDEENKRERAQKVLEKCTELSSKLRKVIESWQTNNPSQSQNGNLLEESTDKTRISLIEMKTELDSTHQDFITQAGDYVDFLAASNSYISHIGFQNPLVLLFDSQNEDQIAGICPGLTLKNYQLVGVNWLYVLHKIDVNGVLADEMGLGKTIQTIAFLAFVKARRELKGTTHRPNLVVVPASTLGNWASEIQKFCPDLETIVYQGNQTERSEIRQSVKGTQHQLDVILTTYSCFQNESATPDRKFFKSFKFGYMVLDEAHSIKNQESSRFRKLSLIKSERRLLLSGTPVQNKLEELMSLLSFLMPKLFEGCTEALMELLQVQLAVEKVATGNPVNTQTFKKIQNILAPFVMRRLKSEVLGQLPPKTTTVEYLECQEMQKEVYVDLLRSHASRIAGDPGSSGKPKMKAAEAKHIFTDLRKASNHPLLLRIHFNDQSKMDHVSQVLLKRGHFGPQATLEMVKKETNDYSDYDLHLLCTMYDELRRYELEESSLFSSTKFQKLQQLIPDLQTQGHRMLLFSQWTRILDLLEVFLQSLGLQFLRLDGSTEVKERQHLIARFTNDTSIPVFLLSTRAGGLGINLTCADTVILHDLDWNPTNDRQAEDRCHRIGQTRPVQVIKLVVKGTVDEDIYTIGNRKSMVTAKVLDEEDGVSTKKQPDSKTISQILLKALEQNALLKDASKKEF